MPSTKIGYQSILKKIDREIRDYEQIAEYMKEKEKQLDQLDSKGFEKDVDTIRKLLKDLNSQPEVEFLFDDLNNKIRNYKKRSEILRKQLHQLASNLNKNDVSKIDRLLSNPVSINKAEQQIEQIKQKIDERNRICFPIELTHYTDTYLIGNGGFARVYKAKNIIKNQIVAVKIPIKNDASIGKSFMRELTNWVRLKHKNIVEVYSYNVFPVPYFEMELCDFCLDKVKKPLEINDAINCILGISDGLIYAHQKKIVHLDLKPQNILLKEDVPKISDWGMSKLITEQGTSTIGLSLPFAAPEQFSKKFGKKDEQTDIWQVGVLLYHLLTDKLPFSGKDFVDYGENITRKNIAPIIKRYELSTEIINILQKCLAKKKKDRYKTVKHLQKDLKKIIEK